MRYAEPNQPGSKESTEESLRQEVEDLKRQLREKKGVHGGAPPNSLARPWHPSGVTIWALFLGALVLLVVAFFAGYIPLQKRNALIASEAQEQEAALPRV